MLELYWGFFIGGVLFALVTILLGDLLHFDQLPFFEPIVLVTGITVFGGAGILLTKYSTFTAMTSLLFAIMSALILSIFMYFLYVKNMRNVENSTGFSIYELVGRIGEVSTTIPSRGHGEVVMKIGVGLTNQIAASFDQELIPHGTKVVVVEVREDTLYVSRLEMEM